MITSQFLDDKELLDEIQKKADLLGDTESKLVKKFINDALDTSIDFARNVIINEHGLEMAFVTESVIQTQGRPAILIQNQTYEQLTSEVWESRLETSRNKLEQAILAVGRIELRNHPRKDIIGTGWLISSDVIVTNRHVAEDFAERTTNGSFIFRRSFEGTVRAVLDFREEYLLDDEREFFVEEIIFMEENSLELPDIAFLKIKKSGINNLGESINLSAPSLTLATDEEIDSANFVAAIGYPGDNFENLLGTNITSEDLRNIFRGRYNKCLMPGQLIQRFDDLNGFKHVGHDCSTLAGCSGSPLIDLNTGKVVGLHIGGKHGDINYALHAQVIEDYMERFL